MENETIICVDCGQEEEISDGWYKLMEQNPGIQKPKRCFDCRQKRKKEKEKYKRKDIKRERW